MQMDYGSSSVSQLIVAKFLSTGKYDSYLTKVRGELKRRRDHMLAMLDKHFIDIATWSIPQGGFYIWLELKKDLSMQKIFEQAFEEKILFNPGYIYESSLNKAFRLSYSYASYDEIKEGLIRLAKIIKTQAHA